NQYIGGTKEASVASIYRACFGPSELKLWHLKYFVYFKSHGQIKLKLVDIWISLYPDIDTLGLWFQASLNSCRVRSH
ncbi:hypothetical protein BpHYR1_048153, partial [Brachionus plicatilis]